MYKWIIEEKKDENRIFGLKKNNSEKGKKQRRNSLMRDKQRKRKYEHGTGWVFIVEISEKRNIRFSNVLIKRMMIGEINKDVDLITLIKAPTSRKSEVLCSPRHHNKD